jgi:hypothetical protein
MGALRNGLARPDADRFLSAPVAGLDEDVFLVWVVRRCVAGAGEFEIDQTRGMQSRTVTQNIDIFRWPTNTRVQLNTRSVGTTEVLISSVVPSGRAANYVSARREVRVRDRSVGWFTNFFTTADLLQISFDRP